MELLHALGIEPKLLLAQIVNFTILLLILWKVAYKPLLAVMKERSQRIEAGLEDAERLKKEREQWEQEHVVLLKKAREEAKKLVDEAQQHAESLAVQARERTKQEVTTLLLTSKKEIELQEKVALKHLEDHVAQLVADVSGKFLMERIGTKEDEQLIKKIFQKV